MTRRQDLTNGDVRGHLWRLGMPMVIGIIAVMSIGLADAYFLGQLGTAELAAISFSFPVTFAIASVAIGLGAGASSVVSRVIGTGDHQRVRRLCTDSLALSVLVVAVLSVVGWLTSRHLFSAMGAEGEVLDLVVAYMDIWYIGMPFLVVPMVAGSLLRANGDARIPSLTMVLSAVVNILLDPILIFGLGPIPAMGMEGAAWATLVARGFSMVLALSVLIFRERLLILALAPWAEIRSSWQQVVAVGVPASLANMINPLCLAILTAILARFGSETVAAFGVAGRIEALAAIPMLALSASIGPITGQNMGAGLPHRIRTAVIDSFLFCIGWGAAMAILFWLFGAAIAGVFSDDPAVINDIVRYLQIVPITLGGYGVVIIAAATYNALGRGYQAMGFYLLRSALFYVPLAWLASFWLPAWGVFAAIAVANVLSGAVIYRLSLSGIDQPPKKG
ncbi:MAG: MATE family efflux transporter [Gammaproteobacteria bacterium HGW-Gammaproteobacteria-14]|nr:MAG: MATE family efflux transporter [Gammaproteobacteria bacterium HGW-Gammaproteobacteria-14]